MVKYNCIFLSRRPVENYDILRMIPIEIINNYFTYILSLKDLTSNKMKIMEAGAGSGRFFIPLVNWVTKNSFPHMLTACDISSKMLEALEYRLNGCGKIVSLVNFDLQEKKSFTMSWFDLIYTVATLHILNEWKQCLNNFVEMLKPGGILVLTKEINQFMHRTEGFDNTYDLTEIDAQLDEFFRLYHRLRVEVGEPYEPSGITYSEIGPAIDYLLKQGMELIEQRLDDEKLKWQKPHSYADLLETFRLRTITTWGSDLSPAVRVKIHDQLKSWLISRNIDMNYIFYLPARLQTFTFKKAC